MPTVVLDMMDRRPIWAMPDWVPVEIADALPAGWELVVIDEETDGSGDGAIADILTAVWLKRRDRYSETRKPEPVEKPLVNKVEMYRMGG